MTSFENENPVSSAAAAPAQEPDSSNKPEQKAAEAHPEGQNAGVPQQPAQAAHAEPIKQDQAHEAAEAHAQNAAADAEAAAAAGRLYRIYLAPIAFCPDPPRHARRRPSIHDFC